MNGLQTPPASPPAFHLVSLAEQPLHGLHRNLKDLPSSASVSLVRAASDKIDEISVGFNSIETSLCGFSFWSPGDKILEESAKVNACISLATGVVY